MSYVIHVWESPRPATFEETVSIAFALPEDVGRQHPKFLILAGLLTARFPCITHAQDGVWSDGPLDGRTERGIYVLGIRHNHEEVLAHIVDCAGRLGLTVFDMQSSLAYLPSGQTLAPLTDRPDAAPAAVLPAALPEPPLAPAFAATPAQGYLVHVWEEPVRFMYHEVADTVFKRADDVLGQNLRFMVLAEWLNARFPCNTLEPHVWRAGAVDGHTEKRVMVLDICNRHQEVVAYIVACAAKLKLSVFDRQAETAFPGDGGRLRDWTRSDLLGPPRMRKPESLPDIRDAIHTGMMRVLGDVGFVYDRTDERQLILRFPGGWHTIGVPAVNAYRGYQFSFHVITRLDEVAAIAAPFKGILPDRVQLGACSMFNYGYLYGEKNKEYEVVSREGLALAIMEMNSVIVDKLLPLLDRISDVRGMDALFNGPSTHPPFQTHRDDGFDALTLARLAGNPDYPALCAHYVKAIYPGNRQLRRDLPRLIAYLDHYDADNPAPPPPYPFDDVSRFIAHYDGSQVDEIALAWVSTAGQEFFDANSGFRADLIRSGPTLELPLILLRDLLRAEAMACTAMYRLREWLVANLFYCLLWRGGVAELALCAQCVPVSWLSEERMTALPFAPDFAESLRHACEKRAVNPWLREQAGRYAALETYFAALAARGQA